MTHAQTDRACQDIALIRALDAERQAVHAEIGQLRSENRDTSELVARSRAISMQIKKLSASSSTTSIQAVARAKPQTEVLNGWAQIKAAGPEWQALMPQTSVTSPYMTWEWMSSWYEAYGDVGCATCLIIRDDSGNTVGVVPLHRGDAGDRNLRQGEIGFAGTLGRAWASYQEFISVPQAHELAADATAEYLNSVKAQWTCAKFVRVPTNAAATWHYLAALIRRGWYVQVRPSIVATVMRLPLHEYELIDALHSRRFAANCRQAIRRLAKDHPDHRFDCLTSGAKVAACIEPYVDMNVERRRKLDTSSRFLDARYLCQFTLSARRLADAGWLRFSSLRIGGRIVGLQPSIIYHGRVYLLSPAWAAELARYEISHQLFLHAIGLGIREGATEADFLSADQEYKRWYSNETRSTLDIVCWQSRAQMLEGLAGEAARTLRSKAMRWLRIRK